MCLRPNGKAMRRAHPIAIFAFLYRFIFLLILPLLRGFLTALSGNIFDWAKGAWFDIIVVILIIALAILKWWTFSYIMDTDGIAYKSGIFMRQSTFIPAHRISMLATLKPFWLRPFGICKLRLDTIAKHPRKADLVFYLRYRDAQRLMLMHMPPGIQSSQAKIYRPPMYSVVFLSLFTSNTFIGVMFISTFVSQAGKIIGSTMSDLLVYTFEEIIRKIAFGIPPIAAWIAVVLTSGWGIAFLMNLLQTKNLKTTRINGLVHISGGVLVEKEYLIDMRDLSYIDIRQSLLTRAFRLYSVYLTAIGTGKDKSDIAAIIPFAREKHVMKQLSRLLPNYQPEAPQLRPNRGALLKFIIAPFWPCLLLPILTAYLHHIFPVWGNIILFAGLMLCVPSYWFLGVRIMDFLSSGASRQGDCYTLRYSNLFYLHTIVLHRDQIAHVNMRQSILQRRTNKCDIVISSRAEGRKTHHLRNLDWDACAQLFDMLPGVSCTE